LKKRLIALFIVLLSVLCITQPQSAVKAATRYIFATFDGDAAAEQKLWIYTSTDALNWTLYSNTGFAGPTGALRDPSIIKHTDGKYYIAYTAGHWSVNTTYFNVASSTNLVNWTHVASVNAGISGVNRTWAPEFFIDNGVVKVIANIGVPNQPFRSYIYTATNAALASWSGPVNSGLPQDIIDTFVVKSGSTYHAYTQSTISQGTRHHTASSLTGPWTTLSNTPFSSWGTNNEGPALFLMDNGTWRIVVDKYTSNGIYTATSSDLTNWTSLTSISSLSSKRHGTVVRDTNFTLGSPIYYRITNRNSGKVIDVQNPNLSDGAKVGQWMWNSSNWQQWEFQDAGSGYFRIVSRNSGKCLDVNGASTADGAGIIQWACGSGTNQQFQWAATGSFFNLRARHSGKCVNVVGSSTADGALLEQRTCGIGNSFQWSRQ
jgi:hypothetical protein